MLAQWSDDTIIQENERNDEQSKCLESLERVRPLKWKIVLPVGSIPRCQHELYHKANKEA